MKSPKGFTIQQRLKKVVMEAQNEQEQLLLVQVLEKLGAYPAGRLREEAKKNGALCTIAEY